MHLGTPSSPDDSDAEQITQFCGDGIVWCESCAALDAPLEVTLRPTRDGRTVCLTECVSCAAAPGPYDRASAGRFADDHRRHLTRAADLADPRRGTT